MCSALSRQPRGTEGSFSLLRCLPEGEGASSTWEPMGAGWSWLIPMQPLRKRLKRTTHGSNLVTVKLLSKTFRFSKGDRSHPGRSDFLVKARGKNSGEKAVKFEQFCIRESG